MSNKSQHIGRGFIYAFRGLRTAFLTQVNFKIHAAAAVVAVLLGIVLKINFSEWCALAFAAGFVLAAELFNTAIEFLCDRISAEHDPVIGKVKDISAGAVLVAAITALTVGAMIFLPRMI